MNVDFLNLPDRPSKRRTTGTTCLLDNGVPQRRFRDVVESHHSFIDFIKLGWGTAAITPDLEKKLALARDHDIQCFFGGSFFEKAVLQNRVEAYRDFCLSVGCEYVEVSNGTIPLSNPDKAEFVREFSADFQVFSEVGYKDPDRSLNLHPARWIEFIEQDLQAGASQVITEARESGTSGVCRTNGEIRFGLIREILESGVDVSKLVFEAPNKSMQVFFLENIGPNVCLANVAFEDALALETLRLGLRGDTLMTFENGDER